MVVSARAGSGHYFVGLNYEFHAITAAVLGGNYIFGGRVSVARGVWGAILVALLNNSLTILRFEPATQLVAQDIVTASLAAIQERAGKRWWRRSKSRADEKWTTQSKPCRFGELLRRAGA